MGYEKWRKSSVDREPGVVLELIPAGGSSRYSLSKVDVVPIATRIVHAVLNARRSSARLRVFCAVPNALAVAIGREMNAFGEIATMDWDKEGETYLETLTFRSK